MALRQSLMATIFSLGKPAMQACIQRLNDPRWYLVRNLIILLRRFDDPAVMPPLRRLIGHNHPKVHLEALKTYRHFKDPKFDRYLQRELQHEDPERRKNAAFLARHSKGALVHRELLGLLGRGRSEADYAIRSVAVKSLAEIGDAAFLPAMQAACATRNLLRPAQHKKFKTEILRSLVHYPAHAARPWLAELAADPKGEFADLARRLLASLPGGAP